MAPPSGQDHQSEWAARARPSLKFCAMQAPILSNELCRYCRDVITARFPRAALRRPSPSDWTARCRSAR